MKDCPIPGNKEQYVPRVRPDCYRMVCDKNRKSGNGDALQLKRPLGVTSVVLGLNYEVTQCISVSNFNTVGQCAAELLV